jgi:hypothetical protein
MKNTRFLLYVVSFLIVFYSLVEHNLFSQKSNLDKNNIDISILIHLEIDPKSFADEEIYQFLISKQYKETLTQLKKCYDFEEYPSKIPFNVHLASVYLHLLQDQKREAEVQINRICYIYGNEIPGLFLFKGIIECYNDNYGCAEESFIKEIGYIWHEIIELDKTQNSYENFTQEYVTTYFSQHMILFNASKYLACIYAIRGKQKQALKTLEQLKNCRESMVDFYNICAMKNNIESMKNTLSKKVKVKIPLTYFTSTSCEEYILTKYNDKFLEKFMIFTCTDLSPLVCVKLIDKKNIKLTTGYLSLCLPFQNMQNEIQKYQNLMKDDEKYICSLTYSSKQNFNKNPDIDYFYVSVPAIVSP